MGVTVLPPDVNESGRDFTVVRRRPDDGACEADPLRPRRASAASARGRSTRSSAHARPPGRFTEPVRLCRRVDLKSVNKRVLEGLVRRRLRPVAGGVTAPPSRGDRGGAGARPARSARPRERADGAVRLLAAQGRRATSRASRKARPGPKRELLAEREALGFYVSGHPLDRYRSELARFGNATTATMSGRDEGAEVRIGGTVEGYPRGPTKSGGKIGFFHLEDADGRVEVVVRDRESTSSGRATDPAERRAGLRRGARAVRARSRRPGRRRHGVRAEADAAAGETARDGAARAHEGRPREGVRREADRRSRALRDTLRAHPGPCPVGLELARASSAGASRSRSWACRWRRRPRDRLERLFGEKIAYLV